MDEKERGETQKFEPLGLVAARILLRMLEAQTSVDSDMVLLDLYNEVKPELEARCRRGR